jgi:hypothetical protein
MTRALLALALLLPAARADEKVPLPYFGIHVVDAATGRGVPLAEVRTVNDVALVTDSGGWAAFHEPGLMGREVYFDVTSPGYEHPKDAFGYRGVRLMTTPGATATVKLTRTQPAERLYRVTGGGIYRDGRLLNQKVPDGVPDLNAGVLGQDSVQTVPYRGRLFWLWGDTNQPNYPLGNFQTTAATTPLRVDPETGIALTYFTDPEKPDRVRRMAPFKEPGVVWLFGLFTLTDDAGKEALVAHYSRREGLVKELEHGLVRFDDDAGVFKRLTALDLTEKWRFPRGNAVRVTDAEGDYVYFAEPFCHTRVKATWDAVRDPKRYEALAFDGTKYVWQRERPPPTQADEAKLKLTDAARYALTDAATGNPVTIHRASIVWNDYRKRWVLIGNQQDWSGKPSHLGEVWYAEAVSVAGPWRKAVKVATHPRYDYYNPRQHPEFAADGGRVIYFEGTYTKTFSGNPTAVPRYEYNQLMYRLDLADERLKAAR